MSDIKNCLNCYHRVCSGWEARCSRPDNERPLSSVDESFGCTGWQEIQFAQEATVTACFGCLHRNPGPHPECTHGIGRFLSPLDEAKGCSNWEDKLLAKPHTCSTCEHQVIIAGEIWCNKLGKTGKVINPELRRDCLDWMEKIPSPSSFIKGCSTCGLGRYLIYGDGLALECSHPDVREPPLGKDCPGWTKRHPCANCGREDGYHADCPGGPPPPSIETPVKHWGRVGVYMQKLEWKQVCDVPEVWQAVNECVLIRVFRTKEDGNYFASYPQFKIEALDIETDDLAKAQHAAVVAIYVQIRRMALSLEGEANG